jgi:hypothetical protein
MGYRRPVKQFRLQFEDAEFDGLEVIMTSLSTGDLLKVTRGAGKLAALDNTAASVTAGGDDVAELLRVMAKSLVSWNLEDDHGPVPANLDGILTQDLDLVVAVIQAWTSAIAGVAPPLPQSSNGGGQFPAVSIPMVPLSPSPSS